MIQREQFIARQHQRIEAMTWVGVLLYFSDDSVLPINHTDDSLPRSTAHFAPVDRRHRVDHL